LPAQYEGHPTQINSWKNELLQRAAEMFGGAAAKSAADREKVHELHAKIGELTVERDFWRTRDHPGGERSHEAHS
jgi:transposase